MQIKIKFPVDINISFSKYLEKLNVHPVTIAESVSDNNYIKSYNLIQENPNITKEEFLKKMNIEEFKD